MKASEQENIIVLGKLQAIYNAMDTAWPNDEILRQKLIKARRIIWEVLEIHWDKCNELVTEDDT